MMELNKDFANRFIEKIKEDSDYKFMVFNKEGIIIAATEEDRVGVFHEASYNMIKNKLKYIVVHPEDVKKYLGVKNGVDMTIFHKGNIVGGIGITGIPEEVTPVLTVAKIAFEAMLDYEIVKEQNILKDNDWNEFCSLLIRSDSQDSGRLSQLAEQQNLNTRLPRFCIVFDLLETESDRKNLLKTIKNSPGFTPQDIAFISRNHEIVIFKTIKAPMDRMFYTYQDQIRHFLLPIYDKFLKNQDSFQFYVGSMQQKLINYKFSYSHCIWLKEQNKTRCFFYNHLNDYTKYLTPRLELYGAFDSIGEMMDSDAKQELIDTTLALNACNYNLVKASQMLHIHKNTLILHLNKIRELYNINPMQNHDDRLFLDYLCYYLKSREWDRWQYLWQQP